MLNECTKLAQKEYKSRYDWVEKVIRGERCKLLKFDQTHTWYEQKPESLLENKKKILCVFRLTTDYPISSRRSGQVGILKTVRTCQLVEFTVPADHGIKIKETKKKSRNT